MRQRNVKNKEIIINNSRYIILNPEHYLGLWQDIFGNDNPIYIEIGMGKGDFILGNAKKYPNINFIGIEKFDSILALALKKIDQEELTNLKIVRLDAIDIINVFNHEIDKIYLNFSDPWPKKRHESRRLMSDIFLSKYENLFKLGKDKEIEFKTDNRNLFEYSLTSFNKNGYKINDISLDLHNSDYPLNIETEYEHKFSSKGNPIYFVNVIKETTDGK